MKPTAVQLESWETERQTTAHSAIAQTCIRTIFNTFFNSKIHALCLFVCTFFSLSLALWIVFPFIASHLRKSEHGKQNRIYSGWTIWVFEFWKQQLNNQRINLRKYAVSFRNRKKCNTHWKFRWLTMIGVRVDGAHIQIRRDSVVSVVCCCCCSNRWKNDKHIISSNSSKIGKKGVKRK